MEQRIVVTLIHGTWARRALWTRRGSALRTAIEDAFPGGVEFRPPFCWSGGNAIGARHDAAQRLRKKLVAGPTPDPDVRHFLVAHSHGGNIALYALRDLDVCKRIAGVAVLATPFLIAKRRDLGTLGQTLFCLGFLGWGGLAGYLAYRFVWPSTLLMVTVAIGPFFLLTPLFLKLEQRVEQVITEMELARPAPERLWIGRMIGDEAAAGLQTGQLVGWVVAQTHRWFARAYVWAEETGASSIGSSLRRVVAGLGIVVFTWIAGEFLGVREGPAFVLWSLIAVVGIGFLVFAWGLLVQVPRVVVPYSTVVLPLAVVLSSLLILPFGFARAVYSLLLEVDSEPAPVGTWTLRQYASDGAIEVGGRKASALTHSQVYEHEKALRDLTTWMKACAALRPPGDDLTT